MEHSLYLWIGFSIFVIVMIIIDLVIFSRNPHKISIKESLVWTAIWIALSCVFGAGLYWFIGGDIATDYFTGYLIEKSLSMDNIFVFILIFNYFKVPPNISTKYFSGVFSAP